VIFEVVCGAVANLPDPLKIRATVGCSRQCRTALRRSLGHEYEGNTGYQCRGGTLARVKHHSAEFHPRSGFQHGACSRIKRGRINRVQLKLRLSQP
jgi:hypothetical protein